MIGATQRWLKRNRNIIAVGAGVVGVGYLAGQYVIGKVNEARQRMSDDRIAKENLRRRFQQNQDDCTFTILALLPTATENILEALPVEQISLELQRQRSEKLGRTITASETLSSENQSGTSSVIDDESKSSKSIQSSGLIHASQASDGVNAERMPSSQPRKTKAQLWNEMKIDSIARAFTLIYVLALLNLLTRIQLNLLGRRNYLSSVLALAAPREATQIVLENQDSDKHYDTYGNDFEINRKFLTFSWWLLHKGYKAIMEEVNVAVKKVFEAVNPREDITFGTLSELSLGVRKHIEGNDDDQRRAKKWLSYLLPPEDLEEYVLQESGTSSAAAPDTSISPQLRHLLDETADLIESPAFSHVMTLLLDATFTLLVEKKMASQVYRMDVDMLSAITEKEGSNAGPKVKLANILAVFCKQAHHIGSGGSMESAGGQGGGNEYLAEMEDVQDLEAFSALVYSSNFDFEASENDVTASKDSAT